MRILLVVAAACLACACGSSNGAGGGDGGGGGAPPNTGFAGTWTGTLLIEELFFRGDGGQATGGENIGPVAEQIVVVVNGNSMTVAGICPGGSGHWSDPTGTITTNGSGDSATWSGSYACPAVTVVGGGGCSGVVFTYSKVTATLNGAHLTVIATGNVAVGGTDGSGYQCSQSGTVTATFSA